MSTEVDCENGKAVLKYLGKQYSGEIICSDDAISKPHCFIFDEMEVKLFGGSMDVSRLAKADEELAFLQSLLNSVQEAVIVSDMSGKITYWNKYAETLYGYTREEALMMNVGALVTDDPASEALANEVMNKLKDGVSWSGEFLLTGKNGRIFPAYVTDSPIHNSNGEIKAIIGVSRDITAEVYAKSRIMHAMQKVEHQHRLMKNIAFKESHEVRRPLANIKGILALMKEWPRDAKCHELFVLMNQSVEELDEIIKSVVNLASNSDHLTFNLRTNDPYAT